MLCVKDFRLEVISVFVMLDLLVSNGNSFENNNIATPNSFIVTIFFNANESDTCNLKPLVLSPSMWLLCCVVSLGQSLAGEQEDSTVMRALTSHQCGLCSILTQYHMWGEFVVGSCFAPSLSSGFSGFPLLVYLHKNQNLQIPI